MPAAKTAKQPSVKPSKEAAPSFESVWAILQEVGKMNKELAKSQKETDRIIKENARKAEIRWEEDQKRWKEEKIRRKEEEVRAEKRWEKIEKNLGGIGNSLGELIETLIAARLWEKFAAYPYNLERAYQRVNIYNENKKAVTDIDILLADTEWVMAVEVKRECTETKEVDRHVKRMSLIREYPPAEVKDKKLLGAFACGVVSPEVRDYAHETGFFVLELKGEAVDLIPAPDGLSPKVW